MVRAGARTGKLAGPRAGALATPMGVLRVALAVWLLSLGSVAHAQIADEVPLADILEIIQLDRQLLGVDARTGGQVTLNLRLGERVLWKKTRGLLGMALTDQRILGVAVASGSWQVVELQ